MRRRRNGAPGGPRPTALFVTYTMANPFAVGVFFRALRLSFELRTRGWRCVICNRGPLPPDPKINAAKTRVEIIGMEPSGNEAAAVSETLKIFSSIRPDVVVFGEAPIPATEALYRAALMLRSPLALLEQYYGPEIEARRFGLDTILLYGIRALWEERPEDRAGVYKVIPPFVENVAPSARLPVPGRLLNVPWVTIAGFDERVLSGGVEIAGGLDDPRPLTVTLSHCPTGADRLMDRAGIPADRRLALPLQEDSVLFGLFARSHAVILANGFMQIMEALALGSPVICINRGIGMWGWALDGTFEPYVSMEEPLEVQRARLRGWLTESPFAESQLAALAAERGGAKICADQIEAVARKPRLGPAVQRIGARTAWKVSSLLRAFLPGGSPAGARADG